jgi:hypothetical protein
VQPAPGSLLTTEPSAHSLASRVHTLVTSHPGTALLSAQYASMVSLALQAKHHAILAVQQGVVVVVVVVVVVDVVAQSTQRAGSAATLAHTRFVHAPTFPAIQVHVLQPSNHALHSAGHCLDESCNPSHITALAQRASHAFEYVSPSAHLTGSNARGHAFVPRL